MTLIASILIAALSCRPSEAPTIVYPPSAWTGEVRSASIPGSVPFTNACARLDEHAAAAMYGTLDALIQRKVFPRIVNYGGARNKSTSDLATANFFNHNFDDYRLATTTWKETEQLWDFPLITDATNRNFTAHGWRYGLYGDVLDRYILGDRDGKNISLGKFYYPTDHVHWLHPDIDHDALPNGQWFLDNESATADWSKYMLELGELPSTNIVLTGLNAAFRPFRIKSVSHVLPAITDIDEQYMMRFDFPSARSVVGVDSDWEVDDDLTTSRGRLYGDIFDTITNRVFGVDMTNRPSRRVWWNRQALANGVLSCQCVSATCFGGNLARPTEYASSQDSNAELFERSPNYKFKKETLDGNVFGRIVYTLKAGKPFSINGDERSETCYIAFDREKWEVTSQNTTNAVSVSTNSTTTLQSAWNDETASGSIVLNASRVLKLSDFGIVGGTTHYNTRVPVSVVFRVAQDMSFWPVLRPSSTLEVVGPFVGPMTNWTATIVADYNANVKGSIFAGVCEFIGPTCYEPHEAYDRDEPYSVKCMKPHPMLFESGIIQKMSIHSHDICSFSTNHECIAVIADGSSSFQYCEGRENKDTWAFFRQATPKTVTEATMDGEFEGLFDSHDGDVRSLYTRLPSGVPKIPKSEDAREVDEGQMEDISIEEIRKHKLVVATGTGDKGGFATSIFFAHDNTRGFHFEDVDGNTLMDSTGRIIQDVVLGVWGVSATIVITQPCRRSIAVHYDRKPYYIIKWAFPCMHFERQN